MTIIITRGLPASGKSTWARQWVIDGIEMDQKRARVNRDAIRAENFAAEGVLPFEQEQLVTKLQREQVVRLVKSGYHVVVDDTNLRAKYARAWADLAVELGVGFSVRDFDAPPIVCCRRDFARMQAGGRYVGDGVIRSLADRFGPPSRWPEIKPSERATTREWPVYTPDETLPKAYIVDIDGTIAAKRMGDGARGWHEYHRVGEDDPKQVVIDVVEALWASPLEVQIIFVSGRKDSCRKQTEQWLVDNVGYWTQYAPLFMRRSGDNRADDVVKNEIFETEIKHRWRVLATIDDRQRVVDMWRAKGITCLQVDAWEEAGS